MTRPFQPGDSLYFNPDGSAVLRRADEPLRAVADFGPGGFELAPVEAVTLRPSSRALLLDIVAMMDEDREALAARYGNEAPVVKTLEGYSSILARAIREATDGDQ